jgi:hypothetical protein
MLAMAGRNIEPTLPTRDDFYERLIEMHRGLSVDESALVNAKLVLLLAKHSGDPGVLAETTAAARDGLGNPGDTRGG